MNNNDNHAASRQFVAQPPFWGSKVASITTPAWQNNPGKSYAVMVVGVLAFSAVCGALFLGMQSLAAGGGEWMQRLSAHGFQAVALALLFGGLSGWYWWSRREKIVLSVTGDALTVNKRPGDVYAFSGATLGTWGMTGGATMGLALHLQSGENRFILGSAAECVDELGALREEIGMTHFIYKPHWPGLSHADAMAQLAVYNFVEMRDRVADPRFLLQKKIEGRIAGLFPGHWTPLYSQVTFSHTPYAEAWAAGQRQDAIMARLMPHIHSEADFDQPAVLALVQQERAAQAATVG